MDIKTETKWTDAQLKALERNINKEYTKAYNQCKEEMQKLMAKMQDKTMTPHQRMLIATKYDRLDKLCEQMADVLRDAEKSAERFIGANSQNIFKTIYNNSAINYGFSLLDNTAIRNILTEQVNPFTKIAFSNLKDKTAIVNKLKSELTTALLKGESIPKIARRLKSVAEGQLGNTIRIARTETTRVQNSAHQETANESARQGFNVWKKWVAMDEDRTRDEHREMLKEDPIPYDEPFIVGGEKMMYPGDTSLGASAWNVINCRCVMVEVIKDKAGNKV